MTARPLPPTVTAPLLQLLGWTAWLAILVGITRIIWAGALLAIRIYREEAIEGLIAALLGGVVVASAGLIAAALVAPL
jgi:hypothetical protein